MPQKWCSFSPKVNVLLNLTRYEFQKQIVITSGRKNMRTDNTTYTQSLSILIIDDSTSERMLLRTLLRKLGHSITEAATGLHALIFLSNQPKAFDLIFRRSHAGYGWL